jgi:Putative auto-transporter adhesin, head GIN domain
LCSVKQSTTKQLQVLKMKKIKIMALLSVMAAGLVACNKTVIGEGPHVAQNRPVSNFTGIDLRISADIYYETGNNLSVEVTGQQNILDNLETIVVDGQLVVRYQNGKSFNSDESTRIAITAPAVSNFSLSESGSIYCHGDIETTDLKLCNNGTGTISLKSVTAKKIEAIATGSGDIIALDGTALSESIKVSGSGQIDLSRIQSRTAAVHNAGSGNIRVKTGDHLLATIEGSGPIYYSGYPDVSSHVSGTGQLVHL